MEILENEATTHSRLPSVYSAPIAAPPENVYRTHSTTSIARLRAFWTDICFVPIRGGLALRTVNRQLVRQVCRKEKGSRKKCR